MKRKAYMSEVQRNYDFVKSSSFREASKQTLLIRQKMIEKSYANFQNEHSALVGKMPANKFFDLDSVCKFVEDQYVQAATAVEERLQQINDIQNRAEEKANTGTNNNNLIESASTDENNRFNDNTICETSADITENSKPRKKFTVEKTERAIAKPEKENE